MAEGNVTYGPTGSVAAPRGESMRQAAVARVASVGSRAAKEGERLHYRGGDRDRMQDRKEALERGRRGPGRMKTEAGRNQAFGRTVQGGNYTPGY